MFEGIDDATLRTWLSEAQTALHEIDIHNGKRVEYQRSSMPSLRAYISHLNSALNGRGRVTGIGVIF